MDTIHPFAIRFTLFRVKRELEPEEVMRTRRTNIVQRQIIHIHINTNGKFRVLK